MPIPLIAELVPKNEGKFALLDDKNLRGSYRVCATLADRDAIPVDNLKFGMQVFVQEDGKKYTLESNLVTWTEVITTPQEYIHNQIIGSAVWSINHNLNKFPSIMVTDSGNNVIVGDIQYVDSNNVIVSFTGSFSGKAYLN
jgi:hypothetical protein